MKTFFLILSFSMIVLSNVNSQTLKEGFYRSDKISDDFYLCGDSILFYSYVMAPTFFPVVNKGIFDGKKWLHFVPTPNKLECIIDTISQVPVDNKSVVRFKFKTHPCDKALKRNKVELVNSWNKRDSISFLLNYVSLRNKKHTLEVQCYNKDGIFDFEMPNISFKSAELLVKAVYGTRILPMPIPIVKNAITNYEISFPPRVHYDLIKAKKLRYKYNNEDSTISLHLRTNTNKLFKRWFKYKHTDRNILTMDSAIIQYHVNDLKGIKR